MSAAWLLAAALALAQEPRAVEPELVRALLADVYAFGRELELPAPEDLAALREECAALGAPRELVRELGNLGHRLTRAGREGEGRALVAWCGERALAGGDLATHAWAIEWLGQEAWVRGELADAAALLERAAAADARRGARADETRNLADAARVRLTRGELDQAEELAARAEAVARAAGSAAAARSAAAIRGSVWFELGRLREVLELCQAHAGARDVGAVRLEILAADALADVGRLDAAVAHARRALELARTPEVAREAPLLSLEPRLSLALLLGDLGRTEEALALLDESAAEFARLGDARGAAWTEKNRGFALYAAGRFAEALVCFERTARAGAELDVPFLEGIGAMGAAETLVRLAAGGAVDEERVRAALDIAERVGRELHERTLAWRVPALRGALALARGAHDEAARELERAVVRIERWRRRLGTRGLIEHALHQRVDPYRDAAFAAAHAGRAEDALRAAALLHARVLDELVARRDEALPPDEDAALGALRAHAARLEARIEALAADEPERAALGDELERAEGELDAALLARELESGRTLAAPEQALPLAELGRALSARGFGAALTVLVGERETLLLLMRATEPARVEAHVVARGRAWLEERVARLRAPIERVEAGALDLAHLGFDVRAARELHEALVRPLALAPGSDVALVTDGLLTALPFELFVTGGAPGEYEPARPFAHLAGLRFLGDEYVFVAHGSLASLLRAPAEPGGGALVVLAPEAMGVSSAEDEARALLRVLPGARVVREARPEDVLALAPGAALVHLIAHGRLDPARPAHGALVLGGADGSSGLLEATRVAELELPGATVVLSACHSGRGEWRAGAGLAGLTRGFLEAGAREVVASRWAVDDRTTRRFMELLHAERARGHATPVALRHARAMLRAEPDPRGFARAHPAFWAAWFVQR